MIVYLDASALVKKYVAEAGSREIIALIDEAALCGTSLITRAEVAATIAKLVRMRALHKNEAEQTRKDFQRQWPDLQRLHITENLVAKADSLAWEHGLRGYDAVHLASAISWQEHIGESITLATFDQQLWDAGQAIGLLVWPPK
jgi:predicted nucleic acid-binding protein